MTRSVILQSSSFSSGGDGGGGSCGRGAPSRLLAGALAALGGRLVVERAVEEVAAGPGRCTARDCGDARAQRRSVRPAAAHPEGEHAVEDCMVDGCGVCHVMTGGDGRVEVHGVRRSVHKLGKVWPRRLREARGGDE